METMKWLFLSILCISFCVQESSCFSIGLLKSKISNPPSFDSCPVSNSYKHAATDLATEGSPTLFSNSRMTKESTLQMTSRCDAYSNGVLKPRWGGPLGKVLRQLNQILVGTIFFFIVRVFNKFKAIRIKSLLKLIWNRPDSKGLLTVR